MNLNETLIAALCLHFIKCLCYTHQHVLHLWQTWRSRLCLKFYIALVRGVLGLKPKRWYKRLSGWEDDWIGNCKPPYCIFFGGGGCRMFFYQSVLHHSSQTTLFCSAFKAIFLACWVWLALESILLGHLRWSGKWEWWEVNPVQWGLIAHGQYIWVEAGKTHHTYTYSPGLGILPAEQKK